MTSMNGKKYVQPLLVASGPVLTVALIVAMQWLQDTPLRIPNPSPVMILAVIYASFVGGLWSSVISTLIALGYMAFYFSMPGHWFTYTAEMEARFLVICVTLVLVAWIMARLRRQLHRKDDALAQANERLQSTLLLTSNARDLICAINADGLLVEVNDAWLRVLGYNRDELLGQRFLDFLYEEDKVETLRAAQSIMDGAELHGFENRYLHKNGKPVTISWTAHWSASDGMMIGVGRDITELKHAQLQLSESEQRYRSLFDFHPDAVYSYDLQGRFVSGNAAVERITGHAAESAIGQPLLPIVASEDRVRVSAMIRMAMQGQPQNYDMAGYRPDGSRFHVNITNLPIVVDGNIVGVFAIAKDISGTMLAESELKAAQTRLAQAEKLASIGQLAAGIAHEINNPLGYVNSNLTVLSRHSNKLLQLLDAYRSVEMQLDPNLTASKRLQAVKAGIDVNYVRADLIEVVADAREGICRVSKIVQSLKDFSRMEQQALCVPADLHQALDSTLSMASNEIRYKADVVKDYGDLPLVECVIGEISQVFMNLLVNAAQALETRGVITILTRHYGAVVTIAISDNGSGISAENAGRIFDPFFTTKPVGQGTGLGLAISYGIVQKHGGSIELTSEEGKGSCFTVTLPVLATAPVTATVTAAVVQAAAHSPRTDSGGEQSAASFATS
ncbi:PAS domain S-box protein [Undibacterium sp.]|uniref:PAS domain S-box protein n=1 Tax=Undibacterium sp. TaxID=1914977 RepID=UPI00374D343A